MEMKLALEALRGGNNSDAFEAAKFLSSLPRLPAGRIAEAFKGAQGVHNREAAVYALSWLHRRDRGGCLRELLNILNNAGEHPAVRAQALEGLGLQRPTRRHRLWPEVEKAVLDGLRDEAVEVRFWACYAAGTLRMRSALPRLRELSHSDAGVCPLWWRVSEEAADATEWIYGRETEARTPVSGRT